jgi:sulfatase maturation enzyme AslB (radical SAM superfamily)
MFLDGKVENISTYPMLLENGFIKTPSFEETSEAYMREKMSFLNIGPSLHMMVITLRCNHHCTYCHAAVAPEDAMEYDMSRETAKNCVDTLLSSTSDDLTIEFQGGEPLLNWEVLQYTVEYGKKQAKRNGKKLDFALVTNLTIMTEEKLKWLIDEKINICTSLDGSELTHNTNRTGYKGNSFKKVTYWIQRINEEYKKRKLGKIGALLTSTKSTLPHYKEVIDAYKELGLDLIFLRWLNPYGFASGQMDEL